MYGDMQLYVIITVFTIRTTSTCVVHRKKIANELLEILLFYMNSKPVIVTDCLMLHDEAINYNYNRATLDVMFARVLFR